MGHRDPEHERNKRAQSDLEKALKRRDLDLALASLDKLKRDLPPGAVQTIGPLVRRAVAEAHRMSQWARLHTLAIHVQGIPALADLGASAEESAACRWSLLWGCARSRDFPRALFFCDSLAGRFGDRPRLARCLAAILQQQGAVSDEVMAVLPEGVRQAADPRLGHESAPLRPEAPKAPATPEVARESVLLAAARLPLPALAESLQRWIAQASPAVADAIRAAALPVARLELLRRFRDGAPLGPAVRALAIAIRNSSRTSEEVAILIEALRLATARPATLLDLDRDAEGFTLLARALIREPAFGPSGARWLVSEAALAPAGAGRDRLLAGVLEAHAGDFSLWALVCGCVPEPDSDVEPSSWLWPFLERMVGQPDTLARGWATIPSDQVAVLVERLANHVPLTLGIRLVEQSWAAAPAPLRRELCHLVDALSDEGFGDLELDPDEPGLDAGLRAQLNRERRTLTGIARSLWARLGREFLDVDPHLLGYAIRAAGDTLAEQRRFLVEWLDQRTRVEEWHTALPAVRSVPFHGEKLCDAIVDDLVRRFHADAEALSRSLLWLDDRAPRSVMLHVAGALTEAAPRAVQDRSLVIRRALALARRLLKGRSVARKRAKREPPEPRRRKPAPAQLTLDGFGDPPSAEHTP